jgi:hypothetical protein
VRPRRAGVRIVPYHACPGTHHDDREVAHRAGQIAWPAAVRTRSVTRLKVPLRIAGGSWIGSSALYSATTATTSP